MFSTINFWWFKKRHGYPHHSKLFDLTFTPKGELYGRVKFVTVEYMHYTQDLKFIADEFGITQERVKQILLKAERIMDGTFAKNMENI